MRWWLVTALLSSGCATSWTVADETADRLTAMPDRVRREIAVAAIDGRGRETWLRADTLDLTSAPPREGRRAVYTRWNKKLLIAGATLFGAGGALLSAGGGLYAENGCSCVGPPPSLVLLGVGAPLALTGLILFPFAYPAPPTHVTPDGSVR
jgi:hypothetical protein